MKARIHGIEVEGSLDEILQLKDVLDARERNYHFKITIHNHEVSPMFKVSEAIAAIKKYQASASAY